LGGCHSFKSGPNYITWSKLYSPRIVPRWLSFDHKSSPNYNLVQITSYNGYSKLGNIETMSLDRVPLVVSHLENTRPRARLPKMEALTGARGLFAIYVVSYHFFGASLLVVSNIAFLPQGTSVMASSLRLSSCGAFVRTALWQ